MGQGRDQAGRAGSGEGLTIRGIGARAGSCPARSCSSRCGPARSRLLGSAGLAGLGAALLVCGGCRASVQRQGESQVLASYLGRTLTAELPERVRPPAVVGAAQDALAARGYSIADSEATGESGRVWAVPPDAGWLEGALVTADLSKRGTRVKVRLEPLGDEAKSRAVLDAVLVRLGR